MSSTKHLEVVNAEHAAVSKIILPRVGKREAPLSCIENLEAILKHFQITVRYNVISKEREIIIPEKSFGIDNKSNAAHAWIISLCGNLNMPIGQINDFLTYIADQNQYNPVATWITSKPWDKKSRLEELYATVETKPEHEEIKKILIKRWLISAVTAALKPDGINAHGVLVFQGDQNLGKTSWFNSLVPKELGLTAEGKIIQPGDRDSVMQVIKYWLVELGELDATFKKAEMSQLKAFLTRSRDQLRRSHARDESDYPRRTVFFASVNPKQFLHDETGNRRFWSVACTGLNFTHSIDMQQLWVEVYEDLYLRGQVWYLEPSEYNKLNQLNEEFETKDPMEERIAMDLNWTAKEFEWKWLTATQVLQELGHGNPTPGMVKKVSQAVFKRNGNQKKKSNGIMKLFVPPKVLRDRITSL